jgi:lactoylglutathione lyase
VAQLAERLLGKEQAEGSNPSRGFSDRRAVTPGIPPEIRRVEPMQFRMIYTGIRVKDIEESIRFYTEILGMQVIEPLQPASPTNGRVVTLRSADSAQVLELNWYGPGSKFGTPYANGEDLDHLAFECTDLAQAVRELERHGVEVVVRPKEIGADVGWNEAFVKDPNGIWVELLQAKRNPTAPG